jgi:CheY-like chemotaxis protein
MVFSVSDTGIGIAPEHHQHIFDEFSQIDNPLQRRYKGTGLGLPLSRRLAGLLGGSLDVQSTAGIGSTFTLRVPVFFRSTTQVQRALSIEADPDRLPVIVIEDQFEMQLFFERALKGSAYQLLPARTLREARELIAARRPAAILLDILLDGEDTWALLADLKRDPATQTIPVIVVSTVDEAKKGVSLGADVYAVKPINRRWLLDTLSRLTQGGARTLRVLVIDDDEAARYVVRQCLPIPRYHVGEAATGRSGLDAARSTTPDAVVLDLNLPDLNGREVLAGLRQDPTTAHIPVIIVSSHRLDESEQAQLRQQDAQFIPKHRLTRESLEKSLRAVLTEDEETRAS